MTSDPRTLARKLVHDMCQAAEPAMADEVVDMLAEHDEEVIALYKTTPEFDAAAKERARQLGWGPK